MAARKTATSAFTPDLSELRAWLEKMIAALRFVEMVTAILALIGQMRDINTELTKQLTHLRCKRPRSETLERLERQLTLPLVDLVAMVAAMEPITHVRGEPTAPGAIARSPLAHFSPRDCGVGGRVPHNREPVRMNDRFQMRPVVDEATPPASCAAKRISTCTLPDLETPVSPTSAARRRS
jgi:hypothetical protein